MATIARPHVKYLVAAGLLGFVLGAFVVGSLGRVSLPGSRGPLGAAAATSAGPWSAAAAAVKPATGSAIDDAPNAVVEVPAPTSGHSGVIPADAPEAKELAARDLEIPVQGVKADALVRTYHDSRSGGREHEALD